MPRAVRRAGVVVGVVLLIRSVSLSGVGFCLSTSVSCSVVRAPCVGVERVCRVWRCCALGGDAVLIAYVRAGALRGCLSGLGDSMIFLSV